MAAMVEFARVSAFTDEPLGGNPAAVCFLPHIKEEEWLQQVASEFNLSETAFLIPRPNEAEPEFDLRWFTPKFEVDLCGHATLAAAHALFSTSRVHQDIIKFHTKSGILKARKVTGYGSPREAETQKPGVVELDFPICLAKPCDPKELDEVCRILRVPNVVWCGKSELGDYLVELTSIEQITSLDPDFDKMASFSGRGGVIVTAQSPENTEFEFISRFFCPKAGIPEDPVTGSAHCTLGPYWAKKLDKNELRAYQASERGGKLFVRVNEAEDRVYLQGSAITFMEGKFCY